MEQDVHAPGFDARGVAFPGVNLFVQLGHGRDYAWSATTSAQDIVDTFAVAALRRHALPLPRRAAARSRCSSARTSGARTPPTRRRRAARRCEIERTALGIVIARGDGRAASPVAFTRLREHLRARDRLRASRSRTSTTPTGSRARADFQRAAALIPFTFNWFYVDREHIAYQNAGANPLRAARRRTPACRSRRARFEWRELGPGRDTRSLIESLDARVASTRTSIDQNYIADWNGKQAHGYGAADGNWGYGPGLPLEAARRPRQRAGRGRRARRRCPQLAEAMADAATVDLRGDAVLPWALRVLGRPRDPALRDAVDEAARVACATARTGSTPTATAPTSTRRRSRSSTPGGRAGCEAQFEPVARQGRCSTRSIAVHELDNHPNNHGDHVGSAWQDGWYSFAQKDLRTLLGRRVRGRWSRTYCGRGSVERCRARARRAR